MQRYTDRWESFSDYKSLQTFSFIWLGLKCRRASSLSSTDPRRFTFRRVSSHPSGCRAESFPCERKTLETVKELQGNFMCWKGSKGYAPSTSLCPLYRSVSMETFFIQIKIVKKNSSQFDLVVENCNDRLENYFWLFLKI